MKGNLKNNLINLNKSVELTWILFIGPLLALLLFSTSFVPRWTHCNSNSSLLEGLPEIHLLEDSAKEFGTSPNFCSISSVIHHFRPLLLNGPIFCLSPEKNFSMAKRVSLLANYQIKSWALLDCSYYFLRLNILDSQAHPPTF